MRLFYCILVFLLMHVLAWFSSNAQFINEAWKDKSLLISMIVSIPLSLCAYYGTKLGYEPLGNSVWGIRFVAFGISYLVFPILTYYMLGESMFTLKTMICIFLSIIMIAVQILM